jgi:hypothetical protein
MLKNRQTVFRLVLAYFLILLSLNVSYGQKEKQNPINYSVRGKALIGPGSWEGDMVYTYTIGNELLYKRHSIGIDFTSFRFVNDEDDDKDLPLYDNITRRRYLLLDYKYVIKQYKWGDLYLNAYEKKGYLKDWYVGREVDSIKGDISFLGSTKKGTFNDTGLGIGSKFYFGNFGIDVSANAYVRFSSTDIIDVKSSTLINYLYDVKKTSGMLYIRVNLFYEFGRSHFKK